MYLNAKSTIYSASTWSDMIHPRHDKAAVDQSTRPAVASLGLSVVTLVRLVVDKTVRTRVK